MTPDVDRRHFLGAAAMSIASMRVGPATSVELPREQFASTTVASLDSIKQIDAGVLNVGYADLGPASGPAVLLLHGWPYDIQAYADVAPALAKKGYRVIVPFLRGYGSTRFRSDDTMRNGQQAVLGLDMIKLMDALRIQRAVVAGFDWGSRTAAIMGALWPDRCTALVLVSGYLIVNRVANQQPLPPRAELGWWYQYYFATERGRAGYAKHTSEFNKLIWERASPTWKFDASTYDRTAQAFTNPDHVAVVVHNYRWRLRLAEGEAQCDALEEKLAGAPKIGLPTITIASDFDGAAADGAGYRRQFTGKYEHRILKGIGHNLPQEAPAPFTQAILDVDRMAGQS